MTRWDSRPELFRWSLVETDHGDFLCIRDHYRNLGGVWCQELGR